MTMKRCYNCDEFEWLCKFEHFVIEFVVPVFLWWVVAAAFGAFCYVSWYVIGPWINQ